MDHALQSDLEKSSLEEAVQNPDRDVWLTGENGERQVAMKEIAERGSYRLPGLQARTLAGSAMLRTHALEFPYLCGEMANGIATVEMVTAAARSGLLGFFGAAGLSLERIESAIVKLKHDCRESSWGSNLIHSLNDTVLEEKTVDLYLRHGVRRVSASAFMAVRPSIIRYASKGLSRRPDGTVERQNYLFAKLSRPEVARQFLSPAPDAMLRKLVEQGQLTPEESTIASSVPVAEDVTCEADSGGHTDNRPLVALLPSIFAVRDELATRYRYARPIRIGAAGGIGTPSAINAAFSLRADYVMTGSINQSARESGLSEEAKRLIAEADIPDVMMAPAGDMFELGVKVQVLKRGTLFGVRAAKLYEIYTRYGSLEEIPPATLASIEKIFQQSIEGVWRETSLYFNEVRPEEMIKASKDPKHRMALVFRWYLGLSSRWAIRGVPERKFDYQIWCGPAMGAFNQWVAGSFLQPIENRTVYQIARNLMFGAASLARAQQLRMAGVAVPESAFRIRPRKFVGDPSMPLEMQVNA